MVSRLKDIIKSLGVWYEYSTLYRVGNFTDPLSIGRVCLPAYDDNPNIRQVNLYLYDLRLATAEKLLKDEEQKNPGNGYVTFYRQYSKVIGLIISNSPEQYTQSLPEIKMLIRKPIDLPEAFSSPLRPARHHRAVAPEVKAYYLVPVSGHFLTK